MNLKSMFQDDDGTLNPAHIVAIALVTASIVWVSYLVFHNAVMPDLTGVAYLLGGSGAMNICHKAEDIISKFRRSPESDNPAPDKVA